MSFKELMQGKVSTKFMVTALVLVIGWTYLFMGPQREAVSTVEQVMGMMTKVVVTYITLEGGKRIAEVFGKAK